MLEASGVRSEEHTWQDASGKHGGPIQEPIAFLSFSIYRILHLQDHDSVLANKHVYCALSTHILCILYAPSNVSLQTLEKGGYGYSCPFYR